MAAGQVTGDQGHDDQNNQNNQLHERHHGDDNRILGVGWRKNAARKG